MKNWHIIHYLVLCLAVWAPLDNALAGSVISGCPMMSHAFEQGITKTFQPAPDRAEAPCPHHAASQANGTNLPPIAVTDVPADCADGHCCSICLLFGTTGLPSHAAALVPLHAHESLLPAHDAMPPLGQNNTPFRPPIV